MAIKYSILFFNFSPPVQPIFYQDDCDECQAAQCVQNWSNYDCTDRHRFHIPETGTVIVFCIFGTDRWRHTVNIMPSMRCFGKLIIQFHPVMPSAVNASDLQWRKYQRKDQKPEKKQFLQTEKKIKSANRPKYNQWKQHPKAVFIDKTENFQICWNSHICLLFSHSF